MLQLPEEWADDTARRKTAGVPDGLAIATKVRVDKWLLKRAFGVKVPTA